MKKVFISMACVLIALSGCTNGGSNKEYMEVVLNIKRKVKPECVSCLKGIILEMQGKHVARTGDVSTTACTSPSPIAPNSLSPRLGKTTGNYKKHGETAHLKQHLNEIKDMGDPSCKGSFRKIYVCPSVND